MQVHRSFARIMLCAMLLALLAACGGAPTPPAAEALTAAPAAEAPTTAPATEAPTTGTATSAGAPAATQAVAAPAPNPNLKGEISVSLWATVDALEADPTVGGSWGDVYRLIKKWQAAHPDVKINWVSFPEGDALTRR